MRATKVFAVAAVAWMTGGFAGTAGEDRTDHPGDVKLKLADSVPLDEEGYHMLVTTGSSVEMKRFIERMIAASNLSVPADKISQARFDSIVPVLGNSSKPGAFARLEQFLHTVYGEKKHSESSVAASIPLNEHGFHRIAALHSDSEMKQFILRLIASKNLSMPTDSFHQHVLNTILPAFRKSNSKVMFKKLENMLEEVRLEQAKEIHVADADSAPLDEEGFLLTAALESSMEMRRFVLRLAAKKNLTFPADAFSQTSLNSVVAEFQKYRTKGTFRKLEQMMDEVRTELVQRSQTVVAESAPLNEAGFQRIVDLGSNAELKKFIMRIIASKNLEVPGDSSSQALFDRIVPVFGGSQTKATFKKLVTLLERVHAEKLADFHGKRPFSFELYHTKHWHAEAVAKVRGFVAENRISAADWHMTLTTRDGSTVAANQEISVKDFPLRVMFKKN